MQFAVLVYEKPGTYEALSAPELEQMTAEYLAIAQLAGYIGGAQLQSIETASAVRVEGGETLITDGPFANTKEVFGGFYLFEAESLDPVLEIALAAPRLDSAGWWRSVDWCISTAWKPLVDRACLSRAVAARAVQPGRLRRRLRSCRVVLPGGVRDRAEAARDDRDDQRMGLLGGPGPDRGVERPLRHGCRHQQPTHRGPAEDELR